MGKEGRVIIFSRKSPGPTNFFDPVDNKFLDCKLTLQLIDSGVAEIENADKIPYIILLHVSSGRFYDTTRNICISETEAKNLTDRNVATLKIVLNDNNFTGVEERRQPVNNFSPDKSENKIDESDKNKLKERLLVGATAAGGTTAIAAGAASVPFAMGFTSAGVAAGSAAAAIQSSIGSVAAGSGFAAMQSIAATTVIGTALPLVVAGVAVAGTVTGGVLLHKHLKKKKEKKKSEKEAEANLAKKSMVDDSDDELLDDDVDLLDLDKVQPPDYEDPPPYSL